MYQFYFNSVRKKHHMMNSSYHIKSKIIAFVRFSDLKLIPLCVTCNNYHISFKY